MWQIDASLAKPSPSGSHQRSTYFMNSNNREHFNDDKTHAAPPGGRLWERRLRISCSDWCYKIYFSVKSPYSKSSKLTFLLSEIQILTKDTDQDPGANSTASGWCQGYVALLLPVLTSHLFKSTRRQGTVLQHRLSPLGLSISIHFLSPKEARCSHILSIGLA